MSKSGLIVLGCIFVFSCSRAGFDPPSSVAKSVSIPALRPGLSEIAPGQVGIPLIVDVDNQSDKNLILQRVEISAVQAGRDLSDEYSARPNTPLEVVASDSKASIELSADIRDGASFGPIDLALSLVFKQPDGILIAVSSPRLATSWTVIRPEESVDRIVIMDGSNQNAVVGSTLNKALTVQVLGPSGAPIEHSEIKFEVIKGGGMLLDANPVLSDEQGRARMRVRLGERPGDSSNGFLATAVTKPEASVQFLASSVAGPPAALRFTVQPDGSFANTRLFPQPQLETVDSFGNAVDHLGTVTIAIATGAGQLSGTLSAPLRAGRAAFSDLSYSLAENVIVLEASSGALTEKSAAFTIESSTPPPGACLVEDNFFQTAEGGCRDLATGLVWGGVSSQRLSWYDAIWDASVSGAQAPDAEDKGRTNDYEENDQACFEQCDNSSVGYCHDLIEGGFRDWRLPTVQQWRDLCANFAAGGQRYLPETSVWSASGDDRKDVVTPQPGGCGFTKLRASLPGVFANMICVRGESRAPPTKVSVLSGPKVLGIGSSPRPRSALVVAVQDEQGKQVNREGIRVTLASSTLGRLGGVLEAETDHRGRATFAAWTLDKIGSATLEITAPSLTKTAYTLRIGAYPHTCLLEDEDFQTADGGCKHGVSGLTWSLESPSAMTWSEAIWDSLNPPNNRAPDANDGGRTDDYDPATISPQALDTSILNYCHELDEGGFQDWRVPTDAEFNDLYGFGQGSTTHFASVTNLRAWSASRATGSHSVTVFDFSSGLAPRVSPSLSPDAYVICVRPSVTSGP